MNTLTKGWTFALLMTAGAQAIAQHELPATTDTLRDTARAVQERKNATRAVENVVSALDRLTKTLERLEADRKHDTHTRRWCTQVREQIDVLKEKVNESVSLATEVANMAHRLRAAHETHNTQHTRTGPAIRHGPNAPTPTPDPLVPGYFPAERITVTFDVPERSHASWTTGDPKQRTAHDEEVRRVNNKDDRHRARHTGTLGRETKYRRAGPDHRCIHGPGAKPANVPEEKER